MSQILQFGTGRFLRGFFDCIVSQPRCITVIQSVVDSQGAAHINRQTDGYHVWTRGKQTGQVVDEFVQIRSLACGIDANRNWPDVLQVGLSPELRLVVSNTTEAGLQLDPRDQSSGKSDRICPHSFPGKLLVILHHRYRAGLPGLTILPLELVEYNADRLHQLVQEQARLWPATQDLDFLSWLSQENRWLNNLVDRIVVGVPASVPWQQEDALAVVAEPFRMLAIQRDGGPPAPLPDDEMIDWVDDLRPRFIRKVRILNGLHTAMVAHALPRGLKTVRQAILDPAERIWLESLLRDEILPTLSHQGWDESEFATSVLERFENPFFEHRLADIAKGHAVKLTTRIQPTRDEFQIAFGRQPEKLMEVLNSSH